MKKLTKQQVIELCDKYQSGYSTYKLAKIFNISNVAVSGLLKRRNIKMRNRSESMQHINLNESIFDNITEESAYWIGFLMADGCIYNRKNESSELSVVLSSKDYDHLIKFRSFLESQHAIISINKGLSFRFSVKSNKLAYSISKYGVLPKKSLTASVSMLENDPHFWRGVIDGDGSLGKYKSGISIRLVGSKFLLEQFIDFIKLNIPECNVNVRPHKSIYCVSVCGKFAMPIMKILYDNSSVFLDRKKQIFNSLSNSR